jgi:hypothetical protein
MGANLKKKNKKNPYMMGLGFPVFCQKTWFNQTGPVWFEPVFGPVQLVF